MSMTQEQQDATWRLLPEDFKKHVIRLFENIDLFILTERDLPDRDYIKADTIKELLCDLFGMHNLTATEEEKPKESEGKVKFFRVGMKVTTPYGNGIIGVDFEGKPLVRLDYGGCCAVNDKIYPIQNNSEVDWLAYRMELAKEITPKVISAVSDNGISSDFCESAINKVATIVDGIVERLKGGVKCLN